MFTVVLDTCVLWPSQQRNFFLSLTVEGLYRPVWSSVVLDELRYEERDKRLQRGEEPVVASRLASRLIDRMTTGFGDALVHGWERLDGTFGLPDRDDEHVVASAVVGGAGAIVTHNQRDFPTRLMPWGGRGHDTRPVRLDHGRARPEPRGRCHPVDGRSYRAERASPDTARHHAAAPGAV